MGSDLSAGPTAERSLGAHKTLVVCLGSRIFRGSDKQVDLRAESTVGSVLDSYVEVFVSMGNSLIIILHFAICENDKVVFGFLCRCHCCYGIAALCCHAALTSKVSVLTRRSDRRFVFLT